MIIRKVYEEHIYLDERKQNEFERLWLGLMAFLTLGATMMIIMPLCILSDLPREMTILIGLGCFGISMLCAYYASKPRYDYYDVWIPNNHTWIIKTGTPDDKTKILLAIDELEQILLERRNFNNSLISSKRGCEKNG